MFYTEAPWASGSTRSQVWSSPPDMRRTVNDQEQGKAVPCGASLAWSCRRSAQRSVHHICSEVSINSSMLYPFGSVSKCQWFIGRLVLHTEVNAMLVKGLWGFDWAHHVSWAKCHHFSPRITFCPPVHLSLLHRGPFSAANAWLSASNSKLFSPSTVFLMCTCFLPPITLWAEQSFSLLFCFYTFIASNRMLHTQ